MRHVDSVWPEAESAARELARALVEGAEPSVLRELHERFLKLDRDWHEAILGAPPKAND